MTRVLAAVNAALRTRSSIGEFSPFSRTATSGDSLRFRSDQHTAPHNNLGSVCDGSPRKTWVRRLQVEATSTTAAFTMQKASSDDALRKQEALTYLRELKERLKNKKDTYDEFLEIMKEFKAQRYDGRTDAECAFLALF
jgi:hypothetical protein